MPDTGPEPPAAFRVVMEELLERAAAGPGAPERLERLRGCNLVVKYGGAAMTSVPEMESWARDLVLLHGAGMRPIVVHGGGPALTSMMERMGIETSFHEGHRITNADAVEVAEMVLSGRVNKQVVSLLQRAGGLAVGLSGTDGGMIRVRPHRPGGADIGFVGWVEAVDPALLILLLDAGYIPVVSSTAADAGGQPHNINADVVTGAVAGAMRAAEVVFLSDVPGVVVDGELQHFLTPRAVEGLLETGVVTGGMRPKLEAGLEALAGGAGRVHLIDGREQHALLRRLLAEYHVGTTLVAGVEGRGA